MARYNQDGTLDPTFSPGGEDGDGVFSQELTVSRTKDLAIQPDGKIVVLAITNTAKTVHLVKLNTDGSLDQTFDSNGISTTDLTIAATFPAP